MQINYSILFAALALAYCFTSVFKGAWFKHKPFNCVKCMTGWFAAAIGCVLCGWIGVMYLPLGIFVGALYEKIVMRWL